MTVPHQVTVPGPSSHVTLPDLLAATKYRVLLSAVYGAGESVAVSATGRTGEWARDPGPARPAVQAACHFPHAAQRRRAEQRGVGIPCAGPALTRRTSKTPAGCCGPGWGPACRCLNPGTGCPSPVSASGRLGWTCSLWEQLTDPARRGRPGPAGLRRGSTRMDHLDVVSFVPGGPRPQLGPAPHILALPHRLAPPHSLAPPPRPPLTAWPRPHPSPAHRLAPPTSCHAHRLARPTAWPRPCRPAQPGSPLLLGLVCAEFMDGHRRWEQEAASPTTSASRCVPGCECLWGGGLTSPRTAEEVPPCLRWPMNTSGPLPCAWPRWACPPGAQRGGRYPLRVQYPVGAPRLVAVFWGGVGVRALRWQDTISVPSPSLRPGDLRPEDLGEGDYGNAAGTHPQTAGWGDCPAGGRGPSPLTPTPCRLTAACPALPADGSLTGGSCLCDSCSPSQAPSARVLVGTVAGVRADKAHT